MNKQKNKNTTGPNNNHNKRQHKPGTVQKLQPCMRAMADFTATPQSRAGTFPPSGSVWSLTSTLLLFYQNEKEMK
jgi:hypothetical protein